MKWIYLIVPLAGCAATGGTSMPPLGLADTCGVTEYQTLVGQPREALTGLVLPVRTRIIAPGDMVTQDLDPERLNIELDESGFITGLRCG
ncbi:MAG: hypothetical protein KJN93_05215 [Alphaproteobacteria bacterium]|nr:hypothetical protein [Alphaproteobacteria bacterium]